MAKSFLIAGSGMATINDGLTRFTFAVGGHSSGATATMFTTEAPAEIAVRDAGTFSNFYVSAPSNSHTTANTVYTIRKSGADTALTVTFAPSETGIKEDTSNSVAFGNTDKIAVKVVTDANAGTTTTTHSMLGLQFLPDNAANTVQFLSLNGATNYAIASSTRFLSINGSLSSNATESNVKTRINTAGASSNFRSYIATNARTTDTTFRFRINGANGTQLVTFAAAETGEKEDTSNSDAVAAGDDINCSITTGTGTETIAMRSLGCRFVTTNGSFPLICASASGTNISADTFLPIAGDIGADHASEANVQIYPRFDFTAKFLSVYAPTNTLDLGPTTVTVRDNGNDSVLTVSFALSETGLKQDTTNSFQVSSLDELSYKVDVQPGVIGALNIRSIGILGQQIEGAPRLIGGKLTHSILLGRLT